MINATLDQKQYAHVLLNITPEFIQNPYYFYNKIRGPLFKIPETGYWVATQYADVDVILKHKNLGDNFWKNKVHHYGSDAQDECSLKTLSHMLIMKNEPDHSRLRKLSGSYFSFHRMQQLHTELQITAKRLIDRVIQRGYMDLINDFSHPYSKTLVYKILGIPKNKHEALSKITQSFSRLVDPPRPMPPQELKHESAKMKNLLDFMKELLKHNIDELRGGLIEALIEAKETKKLSEDEFYGQILQFAFAAHDTTPHAIGNAIFALLKNPDKFIELKNEINTTSTLTPNTLNELLRFDPPAHMINREAFEDVEINGTVIEKDSKVLIILAAANHDPKVFENPQVLNFSRPKNRLLSFGGGIHICMGLHLAQLQVKVAFESLFQSLPHLRTESIENPQWKKSLTFRGLETLMVRWD